jgi:hypothetical protein
LRVLDRLFGLAEEGEKPGDQGDHPYSFFS